MKPEIKKALLIPYGALLTAVFLLLMGFTYVRVQNELTDIFKNHLRQMAVALHQQADLGEQPVLLEKSGSDDDNLVTQLWDGKGRLAKSTANGASIPLQDGEGLHRFNLEGEAWLIYRLDGKDALTVQVAMRDTALQEITLEGFVETIPPLALALILLLFSGWVLTNRALRPLEALREEIRQRKQNDLSPLVLPQAPAEIEPLIAQLNLLLVRLQESMTQEKRFMADAAHQLRTPLAALRLQLDVLKTAANDKERAEAIRDLEQGVERNILLARQLLSLARSEEKETAVFENVEIASLLKRMVDDLAPLAAEKHFQISLAGGGAVFVKAVPEALYALFHNLAHNALHYGHPQGRLVVSITAQDKTAEILFADDGPGIPANAAPRVFDRFYRVEGLDKGEGSGLGLSIAKSIVENHGGTISLTKGLNDTGAGFLVTLPRTEGSGRA